MSECETAEPEPELGSSSLNAAEPVTTVEDVAMMIAQTTLSEKDCSCWLEAQVEYAVERTFQDRVATVCSVVAACTIDSQMLQGLPATTM